MELVFALVFGLVIGSFLNVCIARLPHRESIVRPRSQCPQCQKPIAAYDNIPVLSYFLLGGKCRHCHKKISARYPAIEALTAIVAVLLYFTFGLTPQWIVYLLFCGALVVLAFIDIDHRILPDSITLNGIWIGVVVSVIFARPSPLVTRILSLGLAEEADPHVVALIGSLLGAVVGGGLLWAVAEAYFRFRAVEGMGFGDIKMMAMVGAFLGAPLALFTIMVGSLLGSIIGLVLLRFGGKSRDYELPFGTFLSLGAIVAVLYGENLIQLYMDRVITPSL